MITEEKSARWQFAGLALIALALVMMTFRLDDLVRNQQRFQVLERSGLMVVDHRADLLFMCGGYLEGSNQPKCRAIDLANLEDNWPRTSP